MFRESLKRVVLSLVLAIVGVSVASAKSTVIGFKEGVSEFNADLTVSEKDPSAALVILVHEWWGKNEFVKKRAEQLQKEGFSTLVVDMYGTDSKGQVQVVDNPKAAGELAKAFYQDSSLGAVRLEKYVEAVRAKFSEKRMAMPKIYAIGFCFGGTQVLNFARSGKMIDGVVSFHGGLSGLAKAQSTKAKFLVLNGEADPMVPRKDVDAFKADMKTIKADLKFVDYPGALHAFTNPAATEVGKKFNLPVAYDEKADKASYQELLAFLK